MVGRLVEQQNIRLPNEGPGKEHPALHAAGEALEFFFGGELHLLHQILDTHVSLPVFLCAADPEASMSHLVDSADNAIRNFLGESCQDDSVWLGDVAFLRFFLAGDDPHDAGLAGAVTANQTDTLTGIDLQVDLVEKRKVRVTQGNLLKLEKGHGDRKDER